MTEADLIVEKIPDVVPTAESSLKTVIELPEPEHVPDEILDTLELLIPAESNGILLSSDIEVKDLHVVENVVSLSETSIEEEVVNVLPLLDQPEILAPTNECSESLEEPTIEEKSTFIGPQIEDFGKEIDPNTLATCFEREESASQSSDEDDSKKSSKCRPNYKLAPETYSHLIKRVYLFPGAQIDSFIPDDDSCSDDDEDEQPEDMDRIIRKHYEQRASDAESSNSDSSFKNDSSSAMGQTVPENLNLVEDNDNIDKDGTNCNSTIQHNHESTASLQLPTSSAKNFQNNHIFHHNAFDETQGDEISFKNHSTEAQTPVQPNDTPRLDDTVSIIDIPPTKRRKTESSDE